MTRRTIPLLLVLAILFTIAPVAMADHCYRCRSRPFQQGEPANCQISPNHGFVTCTVNVANDTCTLTTACGDHASLVTPLASEFQVASVERLDEPQTAATDTLVAAVRTTTAPATR
jgi:hypothetical protein